MMKAVDNKLRLFMDDPFSPLLNNHALQGEVAGLRSINISGDWRALYSLTTDVHGQQVALFEALGRTASSMDNTQSYLSPTAYKL